VDAFPGREFRGQLKTIYPSLEEKTRSLLLEAVLTNADRSLRPGLFARVTLYTGRRAARSSPDHRIALRQLHNQSLCCRRDRAKERQVKIGRKYGEFMEITEGLKENEIVVTVGQNNLMEGCWSMWLADTSVKRRSSPPWSSWLWWFSVRSAIRRSR